MRVPIENGVLWIPNRRHVSVLHHDRDEAAARFDQPSCEQCALSPSVSTVAILERLWFLGKVEGVASSRAGEQIECVGVELIHRCDHAAVVDISPQLIEAAQQSDTILKSRGHAVVDRNILDRELGIAGVARKGERRVRRAKVSGSKTEGIDIRVAA